MDSGLPIFYTLDTTDGSLMGSVNTFSPSPGVMANTHLGYSETFQKIYILSSFGSSFYKLEYDPTTLTFGATFLQADYFPGFVTERNGFTYMGGLVDPGGLALIAKVLNKGQHGLNQKFKLIEDPSTMNANASFTIVDKTPFASTTGGTVTVVDFTLLLSVSGTYQHEAGSSFYSDVQYETTSPIEIFVQESFTGDIEFSFSCSESGSESIIATIADHPDTSNHPFWVSADINSGVLEVSTPAYGEMNSYYFTVRETIFSDNNDRSVTLIVQKCSIDS